MHEARKGLRRVETLRRPRLMVLALIACLGVCGALANPASAGISHTYVGSIGSAGSLIPAPYPVSSPTDIAVDQVSGDIWVTDPPNYRVQKFDKNGNFVLMIGKTVDHTTGGNVCTAASGDVCQSGTPAGSLGGFESPGYVAVDNYPNGNGDLYVADVGNNTVQKFHANGALVTSWGVNGQKDGSDATDLPGFGAITGVAVGGSCARPGKPKIGNCSANGSLYVTGTAIRQYTQSGEYTTYDVSNGRGIKVDPEGNYYVAQGSFGLFGEIPIYKYIPTQGTVGQGDYYEMATDRPTVGFDFDPTTRELYQATGPRTEGETHASWISHYSGDCNPPTTAACDPLDSFGSAQLSDPQGVGVDGSSHTVYVADRGSSSVLVFADARPIVTAGNPTDVTDTSVTFTGHVDPAGRGAVTECYFEYGFDRSYGKTIPCNPDPASAAPGSNFTAPTDVTATLTGLSPGTTGHYRLFAANDADATIVGEDRPYRTTAPPAVTGLAAERLTATSADLVAKVNPNGRDTTYRFEYGTTPDYGQSVPIPDGTISASYEDQAVEVHLTDLTPHVPYHYRLVAENGSGTTTVEDHILSFYPLSCPNENVRQQTQANFLPDCRAYELVSPADAGGTQLFPNGPNPGYATSPSRFAFTGLFSTIPGSGGSPSDTAGDLYVATRTNSGWVTKFVGWPSSDTAVSGGPPMGPPGSTPGPVRASGEMMGNGLNLGGVTDGVFTDLGMNRFLSFNDGPQGPNDWLNRTPIGSNAPRVYAADGTYLERWPTNLSLVPDGQYPPGTWYYAHGGKPYDLEKPDTVAPGGARALDCPTAVRWNNPSTLDIPNISMNACAGDVTASADLSHFVFATAWNVFAPDGQIGGGGSVYDNDTDTGAVTVASQTAAGEPIPSEPGNKAGDPPEIPAVSWDGSRILMAAGAVGPCGFATCATPPCGLGEGDFANRCQMQQSHLYMRVDGAITYDVSDGHAVDYVGADRTLGRVYFLSSERLTPDDLDSSTDLFSWNINTDSITRLSKGNNAGNAGEPGNTDACSGGLVTSHNEHTAKCGVSTYTQGFFCPERGGGNCLSDNIIAGNTGEIYFFSQELLDGSRGIPGQQNLYVATEDSVQYVTTLTGPPDCFSGNLGLEVCQRLLRIQVAPDNSHMAFVTSSPVTQYDNRNYKEMYRYTPATREMVCVSCLPSGEAPTSDTQASIDGLFMADDGRTFFSTDDALVHTDTNHAQDVYEYVDGHPQLITLGTGDTRIPKSLSLFAETLEPAPPGLVGVSADGKDVFFGAYDTLVPQDKNGLFLKFYDARSGGGFSAPAPPPPCSAADECHGVATGPPPAIANGTGSALGGGGNAAPSKKGGRRGRKRAHHRAGAHHHRTKPSPNRNGRAGR
jgi:hypothetical protein